MSDSERKKRRGRSNERKRRYSDESQGIRQRRINDRDSDSRDSRSRSERMTEKKKIFGFEIFIDDDILNSFDSPDNLFGRIQDVTKAERINFNPDLTIPDLQGRNVQVYDRDMEKKYQSAKMLLSEVYQKFKKLKNESFSIIIFVPEGMVSLLIGSKGHQINKIMKQSDTTIVVNQPINRMTYRTVKIQGHHPHDIAKACCIIYEILQEKSTIAYSIEKEPSPLDYTKAKVKAKFIFSSSVVNFLTAKKKTFLKRTEEQTKCLIRFKQDHSRLLKRDEDMCVLIGKLQDVQASLIMLLSVVHQFYIDQKLTSDYTLKMLIPSNYVTKLIGQKGYMIRDIIERSGGSQIKILSEKQSQRDARECIISINGTRENKIDASCLILEQIECFKNGGPILQSGKSINENLAQQFKNSIPLRAHEQENQFIQDIESQRLEEGEKPEKDDTQPSKINSISKQPYKDTQKQAGQIKREVVRRRKSRSPSISSSASRSRSRSRDRRRRQPIGKDTRDRETSIKRHRSRSLSSSDRHGKHDRDRLQVKIVVPRKLATDHRELRYIEQLSGAEIITSEQKIDGDSHEAIIILRGSVKENNECMRLLQKRLARFADKHDKK